MRAFSQVLAGVGIVVAGAILLARGSQAGPQAPDKGEKPVVAPAQAGCTCACCASKEQARAALLDVKGEDIYCRIDGTVRIRSLVPDGSVVKEGAVIVELDTSELSRKLADQRIAVQKAESNLKTAQLAFENAKLNLQEFQMDTLTEDDLQSRISLTQSLLEIAKDMQDYCQAEYKKLQAPGFSDAAHVKAAQAGLAKAKAEHEQAVLRLDIYKKVEKPRHAADVQSAIAKADLDLKFCPVTLNLEQQKLASLERQIEYCRVIAPADGQLIYAHRLNLGKTISPTIEEGATVKERQLIVRIVPPKS